MAQLPPYLWEIKDQIERYARDFGLDFFETIFEILSYDEMNMVAARGGFPVRYPHWRFGMEYERLSKSHTYGLSKIYEMVINNEPSYAYLLEGNSTVDQKTVISHVYAHVDFFKNNYYFRHTNRKMIDEMANHATRIRKYIERFGLGPVEDFIDRCYSLDNLIDYHSPYITRNTPPREDEDPAPVSVAKIPTKDYLDAFVNPQKALDAERKKLEDARDKKKKFPADAERDILQFLIEHAPLEKWQRDVLSIIREESYYFAPQGMTKVVNEGWACIYPKSLVFSDFGVVPMRDILSQNDISVSDGDVPRRVYDKHIIKNHKTVEIKTRRGLTLGGSDNHRILLADKATWRRLDELKLKEKISISGGAGLWAKEYVELSWLPTKAHTREERAEYGNSYCTNFKFYQYPTAEQLRQREAELNQKTPRILDEKLGTFLGYMVGDGHISVVKRVLGITTGDDEQAETFIELARELFGVEPKKKRDENKWRVNIYAQRVESFLVEEMGLTTGPSARVKKIPDAVLRSPEPVIRAFLRAYFDCDGYGGEAGAILSTASPEMAEQVQLLLLNYGILSHKKLMRDGCLQVQVRGLSAKAFAEKIGFNLERKQRALEAYVNNHRWFKEERWEDEIVEITHGEGDVYDISVEETHRYAAQGFINHNSFWHSNIMTQKAATSAEIIDFADQHSGVTATSPGRVNPYKLGIELLRHIEERWNKGRFGREWDDCDDMEARLSWDKGLGLGRQKVFEVRKHYNDVTFIDEFFTEDFMRDQGYYVFGFNRRQNRYEITTKEFKEVKAKLLDSLTNFGQPVIAVVDGNFENRGELLLRHRHEGTDLKLDYARDTLANLHFIWKRPVHLLTKVENNGKLISFNGKDHSEKSATYT